MAYAVNHENNMSYSHSGKGHTEPSMEIINGKKLMFCLSQKMYCPL